MRNLVVWILAAGVCVGVFFSQASATHEPADKVSASASTLEYMQVQSGTGESSSGPITILSATLRTSAPTDLVFHSTAECALWTDLELRETFVSQAVATVEVWAEIDGTPVPVTFDSNGDEVFNDPDNGRVVFCNRDFLISTTLLLPFQILDLFQRTRSANAFNWVALNVSAGVHRIELKAELSTQVRGIGIASAGVGKRTLVVEPAKLANDVTL